LYAQNQLLGVVEPHINERHQTNSRSWWRKCRSVPRSRSTPGWSATPK